MAEEPNRDLRRQSCSGASRARGKSHRGSRSRSLIPASFADLVESLRRFSRSHPAVLIGGVVAAGCTLGRLARARGRHSANRDGSHGGRRQMGSRQGQWREPVAASHVARLKELTAERFSFAAPVLVRATAAVPGLAQFRSGTRLVLGTSASPSSATDASVGRPNYGGGNEPGAISTGSS